MARALQATPGGLGRRTPEATARARAHATRRALCAGRLERAPLVLSSAGSAGNAALAPASRLTGRWRWEGARGKNGRVERRVCVACCAFARALCLVRRRQLQKAGRMCVRMDLRLDVLREPDVAEAREAKSVATADDDGARVLARALRPKAPRRRRSSTSFFASPLARWPAPSYLLAPLAPVRSRPLSFHSPLVQVSARLSLAHAYPTPLRT